MEKLKSEVKKMIMLLMTISAQDPLIDLGGLLEKSIEGFLGGVLFTVILLIPLIIIGVIKRVIAKKPLSKKNLSNDGINTKKNIRINFQSDEGNQKIVPPTIDQSHKILFCDHCGASRIENTKFCIQCGTKFK